MGDDEQVFSMVGLKKFGPRFILFFLLLIPL